MKIGILGGSFDPIHNGHLNMAFKAYEEYHLDQVWFIPAGHSPNKNEERMTDAGKRLEMCRLATDSYEFFKACNIEVVSQETSYTYRTLQKLTMQYPHDEFYFIMGADSLDYFDKWYHPEIIASLAHILVVNRDEFSEADLNRKIEEIQALFEADIQIVHCEKYTISSHEIRDCIKNRENVNQYLSEDVVCYINEHHLYQCNGEIEWN